MTNATMTATGENPGTTPLITWTAIGTVFQIAMVVIGHFNEFVKTNVFAIGGMLISLVFAAIWAKAAARSAGAACGGGAFVGGVCAIIGIAVSVALGDTEANILMFGTLGSAVAGLIGGVIAYAVAGKKT
jgi:hypothetical protein